MATPTEIFKSSVKTSIQDKTAEGSVLNSDIAGRFYDVADLISSTQFSQSAGFAGPASTSKDPGTPTNPVYYTFSTAGTYSNFKDQSGNSIVVNAGEAGTLVYNGTYWTKQVNPTVDLSSYATNSSLQNVSEAANSAKGKVDQVTVQILGKNLVNNAEIVATEYYSVGTNSIVSNSGALVKRTGYIAVNPGQVYVVSGVPSVSGGFFNSSKAPISSITFGTVTSGRTFTAPAGTAFVVLNVLKDGSQDGVVQMELGSVVTTYTPYVPPLSRVPYIALYGEVPSNILLKDYLTELFSFNMINPATIDFTRRYSTGSKTFVTDGLPIAASAFIPVEEGKFYAVSGTGIYSAYQGGYFISATATTAVDNITFNNPVAGSGKIFQVPTGQGIKFVVISLNKSGSSLSGQAQMERGEQATTYQAYSEKTQIKSTFIPGSSSEESTSTLLDKKAWYQFTEGEVKHDLKQKAPNFYLHWLVKDKDVVVVGIGTSLTARTTEHCTDHPKANQRPPLMHSNNMASILWDRMVWEGQQYRRYDYPSFFTETGTFATDSSLSEWDDNIYRNGLTRYSTTSGAKVAFQIPISAWQYNFIYRTGSTGPTQCKVTVAEGNGKLEVYDESVNAWVEANLFLFSMRESAPVTRSVSVPDPTTGTFSSITLSSKSNTVYQKRLKFRSKGTFGDSRTTVKNVSVEAVTSGTFCYWGVEWSARQYMITYINSARGSHKTNAASTEGLPRFADNEVHAWKPDLLFFELAIHNDGAAGASTESKAYYENLVNNYVFRMDYELSLRKRATDLNGSYPEMIMFNPSISFNFGGIDSNGQLLMIQSVDGTVHTCLDKFTYAYSYVRANYPTVGIVNSVKRWVDAGFAIFGDLKTATLGSGKAGDTFTNEGSHWNDTGSKIIAKTLTGFFDLTY